MTVPAASGEGMSLSKRAFRLEAKSSGAGGERRAQQKPGLHHVLPVAGIRSHDESTRMY